MLLLFYFVCILVTLVYLLVISVWDTGLHAGVCFDANYFTLGCCLIFVSVCSLFGFSVWIRLVELRVLGFLILCGVWPV